MSIPFDMIAVMLFLGFYVGQPDFSPPPLPWSALVLAGFLVALTLTGILVNRLALSFVRRRTFRYADRRQAAGAGEGAARVALTLFYAFGLVESSFPWSVMTRMSWDMNDGAFPQLAGLLVYFIFFVCAWLPLYGLHREVMPGRWTRASFLVHKARYNLYMLVAWIPFAIFSEWLADALILLPFLFIAAAWAFPYVLAKAWGCRPVPPGPVPDLVRELEKRAGASFSRILLWEPGGGRIQNAAAVGLFPPFRYLFLTPALVDNLNHDELTGVILHELGHVKKRHLLLYMFTTLAGVNLAVMAGEFLPLGSDIERFVVIAALVLFYFRFVFGWMSRTMERQADLFALETTGSASGLVNALEKLGISAGNARLAHSWHHLGIAERVAFLRHAEADPRLLRSHNAKAGRMMLAGYGLSVILLVALGLAAHERLSGQPALFPENRAGEAAHWRRVMRLLPGSAVGPLELAYRLASDPKLKDEATRLAAKAIDLSSQREERDAAKKLIDELSEGAP